MIPFVLPEAKNRESGSNNVTFRILDDADVALLLNHNIHQTVKAGDLCIILEQDGYVEIGEMFAKRHDPNNRKYRHGVILELSDLFEHVMCNSGWGWIPQDDARDISDEYHMFIDDHGDIRVLTGFWSDKNAWQEDPLESLFLRGYVIYTYYAQSEFSEDQFFNLPPGAQEAWERDDYATFRELMDKESHDNYMNLLKELHT